MTVWLIILGTALITFTTRLSFIYLHGKASFPSWFRHSLHYVPAAVLAAIVLPGIAISHETLALSFANPRLLAGIIAGLVAWRTGNTLATIAAGMCSLWLLQLWL
jgi:branched-subunit amino acid transport protein